MITIAPEKSVLTETRRTSIGELLSKSGFGVMEDTLWIAPKRRLNHRLIGWEHIGDHGVSFEHYENAGKLEGYHTRVYLPITEEMEGRYVPTLIVARPELAYPMAQTEGLLPTDFSSLEVIQTIEQVGLPYHLLQSHIFICGMESAQLACFMRKSSLVLQKLAYIREEGPSRRYMQVRLHENVVTPEQKQEYVGFVSQMYEREPLWNDDGNDLVHCVMFTNSAAITQRNASLRWSLL